MNNKEYGNFCINSLTNLFYISLIFKYTIYFKDNLADINQSLLEGLLNIKIGDFGHSCLKNDFSAVNEGETRYCSKELIVEKFPLLDLDKADIFSLGVSFYEMCKGSQLLGTGDHDEDGSSEWQRIRNGGLDISVTQNYSSNFIELLELVQYQTIHQNYL